MGEGIRVSVRAGSTPTGYGQGYADVPLTD